MAVILVHIEDTFHQWMLKANDLSVIVGDFDNLDSIETSLVRAINENFNHIGDLTTLTTDATDNLVNVANEIDLHTDVNTINIGTMIALTTTDKSTLVNAINELDADIGDLTGLTTDAVGSLVLAINEVDSHADQNTTDIGDMILDTTATNLTDAINEHEGDIGSMALDTTATDLTGAINEHEGDIGTMALDTTAVTLTGAINEHEGDIGDMILTTTATDLTDGINEHDTELGDISAMTTTATDVSGAVNELDADIGDMVLTTTATDLTDGINEHDTELGDIGAMTTVATDVGGAINELDDHADTNATSIGTIGNLTTSATADLVVAVNSLSDISYLGTELNAVTDLNTLMVYAYCHGLVDDIATPVIDTDTLLDNYVSNIVRGVTVSTVNGTITVPTSGSYKVKGRIIFACATVSAAYQLKLDNDGTKIVYDTLYNGSTDSGVKKSLNFDVVLALTATDVLSLYLVADAVGAAWTGMAGDFSIERIT